jgi:ABC-2 type transport system permease protein
MCFSRSPEDAHDPSAGEVSSPQWARGESMTQFSTLFQKEVRRFLRVPGQTLAQPVITTALYFLVFGFALGGKVRELDGVSYVRFIVPGLVMLGLIQNAFLNSASSMFIMKVQGTIVDLLVAPISPLQILSAFVLAALLRGILVGGITWLVAAVFTSFQVAHPVWVLIFVVLVGLSFALVGLLVAIVSDKFEQLNIVPTFVITPLTFLGGVFYSPAMLPSPWAEITRANPILYMVEGLRYGLIGGAHPPWLGAAITTAIAVAATAIVWRILATGYKLRG